MFSVWRVGVMFDLIKTIATIAMRSLEAVNPTGTAINNIDAHYSSLSKSQMIEDIFRGSCSDFRLSSGLI